MKAKKAFTMIELVFVIVVIGILASIAVPKFAATRDDAIISKARSDVAAMRSAISMQRQKNILKGDFTDINASSVEALLQYGLDSRWSVSGSNFTFTLGSKTCVFEVSGNKLMITETCTIDGLDDL